MIKEIEINGIMYPVVDRSTLSFDSNGVEQGVEKETVYYWKKGYEPDCYYKADLNFFNDYVIEGCGESRKPGETDEDILMSALKDLKFWCEDCIDIYTREDLENELKEYDSLNDKLEVCLSYIERLEFDKYKLERKNKDLESKISNSGWLSTEISDKDIKSLFPEQKQAFNYQLKSLDNMNHPDIKKMRLKFFFKSKRESKKIQTFLFKLGFKWSIKNGLDKNGYFYDHGTNSFNTKNGLIYHMSLSDSYFEKLDYKDYTNIALNKKS